MNFARENGLRVAVQAEGHSAGPLAGVGEDTLLLKTGRMTGAEVDAESRARVGAAAKWRDVSGLASPLGLAALSGSSAEVGVVGYTLGGGLGLAFPQARLGLQQRARGRVVTADGQFVRADRESEADPFLGAARRRRELRRRDRAGIRAVPSTGAVRRNVRLAMGARGGRPARVA